MTRRIRILSFSDQPRRRSRLADAGATVAGAGVGYAGFRIGKAARAAEKVISTDAAVAARNAREISDAAVRVKRFPRRILGRALRFLSNRTRVVLLEKKKRELPAAVKAGASAAVSGAALGLLPAFRRGVGMKTVLKSVGIGAGTSATVVGGGTVVGSKVLGEPKKNEGAPITKRAAVGSGLIALPASLVAGAVFSRTKGGQRLLKRWAGTPKNGWRPAAWAQKTGPVGAAAIAGTAGTGYAIGHAADEGQQVDTLASLKKDLKKRNYSSRGRIILFRAVTPYDPQTLTGKVAKDRLVKKIQDDDLERRDANILRAGVTGAVAGLALRGRWRPSRRMLVGAGLGAGSVLAVRRGTERSKDLYGDRSRGAKKAENLTPLAGVGVAAYGLKKRFRLSARGRVIRLGRADQPRYAATQRYADSLRAYGDAAKLVDASGRPTSLTQSQLVGAAVRTGNTIRRNAQRSSRLVRDVADVTAGRPSRGRKREWEKSWFQNAVLSGSGAAAVLGHAVLRRKVPAYRRKSDAVERAVRGQVARARTKIDDVLGLCARRHVLLFDYYSPEGWDVRDGRGNSARVFSPTAKKRTRRKAEWHETKDGQRKILGGLAVVGPVAGLAAGMALSPRLRRLRVLAKRQRPFVDARAIDPKKIIHLPQAG